MALLRLLGRVKASAGTRAHVWIIDGRGNNTPVDRGLSSSFHSAVHPARWHGTPRHAGQTSAPLERGGGNISRPRPEQVLGQECLGTARTRSDQSRFLADPGIRRDRRAAGRDREHSASGQDRAAIPRGSATKSDARVDQGGVTGCSSSKSGADPGSAVEPSRPKGGRRCKMTVASTTPPGAVKNMPVTK